MCLREIYVYFKPRNHSIPSLRVSERLKIASVKLYKDETRPLNKLT